MLAAVPSVLDRARLDVRAKTRSNVFSWRGQFTPQFVEYLLEAHATSSDFVLDPFCGSGTVLLESARKGMRASGCEINPAAYAMTKCVTLSNLKPEERKDLLLTARGRIEELAEKYQDRAVCEPSECYRDRYRNLLRFAEDLFARIGNKSEMVVAVLTLFQAERYGKGELVAIVRNSCEDVARNLRSLPYTASAISAHLCDARLVDELFPMAVDLVITSPPYINVFNYHQNYRAILEVLGFDLLKVAESEIGSNRKNRANRFRTVVQYALDMEMTLASLAAAIKGNGLLVLVVGRESRVRGVPFMNSAIIRQLALALGAYKQESNGERAFLNRFGQEIKEDVMAFRRTVPARIRACAVAIAQEHLLRAKAGASGEVRREIAEALEAVYEISPSPLFDKKEII
jgi:16S rRNA G966 N2-methylase RsmD